MSSVLARPQAPGDISTILRIQAECPDAGQWRQEDYEALPCHSTQCWVAGTEDILGFIVFRTSADEMEVLNLAVAPTARRQGIASLLLIEAMRHAKQHSLSKVYLEVRALNSIARKFYESCGFRIVGTRRGYYRDPVDDAVLLAASVMEK